MSAVRTTTRIFPRRALIILAMAMAALSCRSTPDAEAMATYVPIHEPAHSVIGRWSVEGDTMTNVIPATATPNEIARSVDGIGVSMAILEGFEASSIDIEAKVAYENRAAAGVLFHVAAPEGVLQSCMFAAVNSDGVYLWRFDENGWSAMGIHRMPVAPMAMHELKVKMRGAEVEIELNDVRVLSGTLAGPGHGGAGIAVREGIGHIDGFRAKRR